LIDDIEISDREAVTKVVLCSGKLYYDLAEERKKSEDRKVAVIRLEQFYPFPLKSVREMLAKYPKATRFVWAQEEPQNMGGWTFVQERIENLLPAGKRPVYVGRSASASPATGSYSIHLNEQAELVNEALSTNQAADLQRI
jgi:2-oxoglutarate dehydrogenase E1 component